jgi:hypothetical protein
MSAEINNRRYAYGEVKTWPAKLIKFRPDILEILEKHRGSKSWPKFMEEIAQMLTSKPQ